MPHFTQDWYTSHIPLWQHLLSHLSGKPNIHFLEIGPFEGRATLWLLENILTHSDSSITVIDTFAGSMEHERMDLSGLHHRFLTNIHAHRDRVNIIQDCSQHVLGRLENTFDFIYVDGSHLAEDVLTDGILSWRLLKEGGVLIFDDYPWRPDLPDRDRPQGAIDRFLVAFQGELELLHQDWQVAIRKIPQSSRQPQSLSHRPAETLPRLTPKRPTLEVALQALQSRWPQITNPCEEEPIFLLAAGWRSGSTFLQRLLMPHCFLWGEPFGHAGLFESLAEPLRCITQQWPEPHFFYQGESPDELSKRFIANLYPSMESLLQAHQSYLQTLFRDSAHQAGSTRWGIKEVRLTVDHALYLKWLFPKAKFLFLYRNPFDAYRSFAARKAIGWQWYHRWPDRPLDVRTFAKHWRELVTSFLEGHQKVDGLLVSYESIAAGNLAPIEEYLGFPLSQEAAQVNPSDGGPPPLPSLSKEEEDLLKSETGDLAGKLGYSLPKEKASQVMTKPTSSASSQSSSNENKDCVILVPVGSHVESACEKGLRELENRGYEVRRVYGYAAVDQARNQMATDALNQGFSELMWIDSDIAFDPDSVERLRSHQLPICCGLYAKKGRRAFACDFPATMQAVTFGGKGGVIPIDRVGFGFTHTRREVYEKIQTEQELPICNEELGEQMIPFFLPMIVPSSEGKHRYFAEDFAFCERAKRAGFSIMADTTIRLWHMGVYPYGWEEAGRDIDRYLNYTFHINR